VYTQGKEVLFGADSNCNIWQSLQ